MPPEIDSTEPAALMERRFIAQRDADFATIFETSHRLSALRRHFAHLLDYVDYARRILAGQVRVNSWQILKTQIDGTTAYVLIQIDLTVHGQAEAYVEVAELRQSQYAWRHLCSWRLPEQVTVAVALGADLKALVADPDTVAF